MITPTVPDIIPNTGIPAAVDPIPGPIIPDTNKPIIPPTPIDPNAGTPANKMLRRPAKTLHPCSADYALLVASSERAVALVQARFAKDSANLFGRTVGQWRDWTRKKLQVWHKHEYPIVVWDDATPVKAYTLASDALGKLDDEARALLPEVTAIKDEILGVPAIGNSPAKPGLLEMVETFPARYDAHVDETATMAAQIEALEKIMAEGKFARSHNIDLELPVADVKPDGSVTISTRMETFASKEQLEIQLKKMKEDLKIRTGKKYFGTNAISNFTVQQAIAIKKLETYMQEMARQFAKNPNARVPDDVKDIYERILKLYKDNEGITLKDELRLPYWAWDRLRWQQLTGELKSVMQKDLPKLQDKVQNDKILQFLKGLSPEEAQALGVGKIAETSTLWGRTKFGGLAAYIVGGGTAFGTTGYGLTYPIQGAYEFVMGDRIAKQRCASLEDDYQFSACAQEYVTLKFPGKATLQLFQSNNAFLDPDGNIKDEKVKKEVKDLMARRQTVLQDLRFQQNSKEAMEESIRRVMADKDPGSDSYRQRVIETKDNKVFTYGLLGNASPQVSSMLEYRFPIHFKAHRAAVQKILDTELDSDAQLALLLKLEKQAPAMTNWLRDILRDRARFLRDWEEEQRLTAPPPAEEEVPANIDPTPLGPDNLPPGILNR